MERFARIIDTPKTQVLLYYEYRDEDDHTVFHCIGNIDGARFDVVSIWPGEAYDKATKVLDLIDETRVRDVVAEMERLATA